MTWKPPTTKAGQPCRRCHPGALCPMHRSDAPAKPGPHRKLTRPVLDEVSRLAGTATGHEILWTAAGVHPATFYRWLDEGEADVGEGRVTPERELYEVVRNQRRLVAAKLRDAAYSVALGHKATRTTKEGIEVYEVPPDGRLAASLASRLAPKELPPERTDIHHDGEVALPTRVIMGFDPTGYPKPKEKT